MLLTIRVTRAIMYKGGGELKDKDLLKLLKQTGWEEIRIHGSHHILKKDGKIETVPVHNKDVPAGLLNAIMKRTGLK